MEQKAESFRNEVKGHLRNGAEGEEMLSLLVVQEVSKAGDRAAMAAELDRIIAEEKQALKQLRP